MKRLFLVVLLLFVLVFYYIASIEYRARGVSGEIKPFSRSLVLSFDFHNVFGGYWENSILEQIGMASELHPEHRAELYSFIFLVGDEYLLRSGAASSTYFSLIASDLQACRCLVENYSDSGFYKKLSDAEQNRIESWIGSFKEVYCKI